MSEKSARLASRLTSCFRYKCSSRRSWDGFEREQCDVIAFLRFRLDSHRSAATHLGSWGKRQTMRRAHRGNLCPLAAFSLAFE